MYISNDDTLNYTFCLLELVVETFEHPTKVRKVFKPTNKKPYYKTFRTSIKNSPSSILSQNNFTSIYRSYFNSY